MVEEILEWVYKTCGKQVSRKVHIIDKITLSIEASVILRVLFVIKYRCNFSQLVDMTAVDIINIQEKNFNEIRFKLIYILRNYETAEMLKLEVLLGESESVSSIVEVFLNSDWYEREIHEMFGIKFRGRNHKQNLLLPDFINNFPLRKELKYDG